MARAVHWQVGITTCRGRNFRSTHDDVTSAMEEYARFLACAVEPTLLHGDEALGHVRIVTVIGTDENGESVHHVSTPIFGCEHQADQPTQPAA